MIFLPTFFQPSFNLVEVESDNKWTITSALGVAIATWRLRTDRPQTLDVDIPYDTPTPPELRIMCQVVRKGFTGTLRLQLWNSYLNYEDCSEMLDTLASSR